MSPSDSYLYPAYYPIISLS